MLNYKVLYLMSVVDLSGHFITGRAKGHRVTPPTSSLTFECPWKLGLICQVPSTERERKIIRS